MRKLMIFVSALSFLMLFCCGKPADKKAEENNLEEVAKQTYTPPEKFVSYDDEWKEIGRAHV